MSAFDSTRQALNRMAERYDARILDGFACSLPCAIFAKAVIDSVEAFGGPCPRLLGGDSNGVSLTFTVGYKKIFYVITDTDIDVFEIDTSYPDGSVTISFNPTISNDVDKTTQQV